MKILAIETASPPGSIALLDGQEVVQAHTLEDARKTTQHFAIIIEKLLQNASWAPSSIDLVTAHTGPGSFTGLRIGITAAKVFAYAVGAKVVGINTLETLAYQCFPGPATTREVEAVIDAQRGQLFAARFRWTDGELEAVEPTRIIDADQWLTENTSNAELTGPGLKRIANKLPTDCNVASLLLPQATKLGQLACIKAERGEATDPMQLAPIYFRKSAAEEKAEQA